MLPSLGRVSHSTIGVTNETASQGAALLVEWYATDDDTTELVPLTFWIEPKHVWTQTSKNDNSIPLPTEKRLEVVQKLCTYLVEYTGRVLDKEEEAAMSDPSWSLTYPTKWLVYYQTPSGIVPEWKEADGQLSLDVRPEDSDSYVNLLDWLTYEWLNLPPDYQAFSLANVVYGCLPSEAWIGFSKDLNRICGQDRECLIRHIDDRNPVVAERLVDQLTKSRLEGSSRNRLILSTWVRAAFERVNLNAWNEDWVTEAIFEFMPGLMTAPRVPITKHDRRFVEKLRGILERAAAPGGVEHERDRQTFENMMRERGIPTRRSKRRFR